MTISNTVTFLVIIYFLIYYILVSSVQTKQLNQIRYRRQASHIMIILLQSVLFFTIYFTAGLEKLGALKIFIYYIFLLLLLIASGELKFVSFILFILFRGIF